MRVTPFIVMFLLLASTALADYRYLDYYTPYQSGSNGYSDNRVMESYTRDYSIDRVENVLTSNFAAKDGINFGTNYGVAYGVDSTQGNWQNTYSCPYSNCNVYYPQYNNGYSINQYPNYYSTPYSNTGSQNFNVNTNQNYNQGYNQQYSYKENSGASFSQSLNEKIKDSIKVEKYTKNEDYQPRNSAYYDRVYQNDPYYNDYYHPGSSGVSVYSTSSRSYPLSTQRYDGTNF